MASLKILGNVKYNFQKLIVEKKIDSNGAFKNNITGSQMAACYEIKINIQGFGLYYQYLDYCQFQTEVEAKAQTYWP